MEIPITQEGYDRSYLDGTLLVGVDVLPQQVVKRIMSGNLFWDSNTDNANNYLMAKLSSQDVQILQTSTQALFANDPRMTVAVNITFTGTTRMLTYNLVITPSSDPTPITATYIPATNTLQVQR